MKINIKNFAKIENANIVVDGITVIAGENNTGKSTIGKILFSLFNALSDVEDKILAERLSEIEVTSRQILRNYAGLTDTSRTAVFHGARRINIGIKRYLEENTDFSKKSIYNIVENELKPWERLSRSMESNHWNDMIDELSQNISEILLLPEENLVLEVISRYFNNVFHGQINSLMRDKDEETLLDLEIRGKNNQVLFLENECKKFVGEISIAHKAIYIDNPFIVDELSQYNHLNPMNELLKNLLTEGFKEDVMDGIIESVRTKEKLNDIFMALQSVVGGEILIHQSNGEFCLKSNYFNEPLSFHNLSTGMKSFVILKMLLEKGCLKEKDVVILDEPEIHLHPQWQIAYAELIVLLQKHFDLSVVVTTHSPYFVDAVNLFSCKYETNSKVNYYLSSSDGKTVKVDCVTEEIDLIYKKMASPIQMLDTLRYELNNN